MKVQEILPETLEERALGKAIATGIIGAQLAMPGKLADDPAPPTSQTQSIPQQAPQEIPQHDQGPPEPSEEELNQRQMRTLIADRIARQYRINRELAAEVVELAHQYEDPEFPTAQDILAVVGIESSFNPQARSRLRRDPAIGLMQVRPGIWGIDPSELRDVENQIAYGSDILRQYYSRLGDPEAALQAYNIGLSKYRRGHTAPNYLAKYQNVHNWLSGVMSL